MTAKRKRVGVFGGTFDPPHVAHLIAADFAFEALELNRLIFMPAFIAPHKQSADRSSAKDRLAMVRLAIKDDQRFEVSTIEIDREGASYTVDTLTELRRQMPDVELNLLIGQDNLHTFHTWREPEHILDLARVHVLVRPPFDLNDVDIGLLRKVKILEMPRLDISSTKIRERVLAGESIRYLVLESVGSYIAARQLYR